MNNTISRIGISSVTYKKSNTWVNNEEVEIEEGVVKKIALRAWQEECKKGIIKELIKGDKIGGIINASTGAGKTITILSLLIEELKHNKNTKIIVAVPQRDISYGFGKKYSIEGEEIEMSNGCFIPDKKIESILNFLKYPSNHPGKRTFICTHQALIAAFKKAPNYKKYFKNILIVIDEAHHIDGSENSNELGKIEKFVLSNRESNIRLLLTTATLFRGDRNSVVSDIGNYYVFKLPLDRHFEDNCGYLKKIKYDFLVTDKKWEDSIASQIKKGDKTILFIPHTASKHIDNDKMYYIKKIIKSLSDNGRVSDKDDYYSIIRDGKEFKIVDLVNDSVDRKVKDKYISENPNDIDMILAMCKFKEGSDWPLANNIIIVGIRNSLTDLVQMSGRGFRDHKSKNNRAVRITQVIPDIVRSNMKEDVSGKVNEFFQCLFSAFIFEEILSPRKLKLEKEERLERVEQESVGSYNYHELFDTENELLAFEENVTEQLDNFKFNNEDLSKKQLTNGYLEIIKDLVREEIGIENENNVNVIAKDIIAKYKKRTANFVKEISLPSNDVGFDFDMIREEIEKDDVLGYQLLLSTGVWGISDSKRLREVIGLSLETASNKMCHEVCKWMDKNGSKVPSQKSKDSQEKQYGSWVSVRRKAKNGKGSWNFYESDLKIAKKYGYPTLFDTIDREAESNKMCHATCKWMDNNGGKKPFEGSKDLQEKQYGSWVGTRRKAKKANENSGIFYESDLKIAKKYGYPTLFDNIDMEAKSNKMCHTVCSWMKENDGKFPSTKAEDPQEKQYGKWVNTKRQAKKGNDNSIFYESDLKIAKSYGYPMLFDNIDREAVSNAMCHASCRWMDKNDGKVPSTISKDPQEKQYGKWISIRRQAKDGNGSGNLTFYESDLEIAKSYGYPTLFNNIEYKSNEMSHSTCKWMKENDGKVPSATSEDPQEKQYGKWVSHRRQAKNGKGSFNFYESDIKIAKSYGYPTLFDTIDREAVSNAMCHASCRWMDKNDGKVPSTISKDPQEKQYGKWISIRRQAKKRDGDGNYKFYESDLKIAKSYGYPTLFNNIEYKSNEISHSTCKWMDNNDGKVPSPRSEDPQEQQYGNWISNRRKAKKGNENSGIFYESDLKIAKKYGYKDLFETTRN